MIDPILVLTILVALVSAFNPYTLGVLILLCSAAYGSGQTPRKVFGLGLTYALAMGVVLFVAGMGLLYLFHSLPLISANYMTMGIGMFIVGTGLLEVKDYFWYGQGLSLNAPVLAVRQVKALTKSKPGWMAAVALGLFVAVVSTPAIGACYIALMTLLRNHFDTWGVELLALYSSVFILPMLVMVSMAAGSVRLSSLLRWREEHKAGMRLLSGLLLIALGWLLLLVTNGVINLG